MKHLRRTGTTLLALALALFGFTVAGSAAYAQVPAPDPATGGSRGGPSGVGDGNSFGAWEAILIAAVVALVAVIIALVTRHVRGSHEHPAGFAKA